MTQQEFEQKTGIKSNEVFEEADKMYMAAGHLNEDAFCMDYKKHGDSILLAYFYNSCKMLEKDMDDIRRDMAHFLLNKLEETGDGDGDMYDKAVELIGQGKVVRMKLDNGWELWDEDKEYIKAHLN